MMQPSIALFAPHPVLTVTIEAEGGQERESIHLHAGGQGVWVAEMIGRMGATAVLCGFSGGETGTLLRPLLAAATAGNARLVSTTGASGCYVTDRRSGERDVLAMVLSDPPSRHELDELLSLTSSQALACGWLIVTNPLPGDALPLECYRELVANARAGGARTLVDLSSPRLDSALEGEPDLVKINDWELAEFVSGDVSTPERMLAAARRIRDAGARDVVVTRGEQPALVLHGDDPLQLTPPRFEHGHREGCGDAMMGALAATWARTDSFEQALASGAAAGAANFLRRGLGHASREVVEELTPAVTLERWPASTSA